MYALTRCLGFMIACLWLQPVFAGDLQYAASLEHSTWKTTQSPLMCTLSHPIELFGRAEFYQAAGHQPAFRFFVNQAPIRKGKVSVYSKAPGWKYDQQNTSLGQYTYQRGESPFRFNRETSLRMLAELEKGMTPVFRFTDWGDGRDNVTVKLSNVRYRDALGKFRECISQIIPYDFDKVRQTRIHFATGKWNLTSKAKKQLDAVAAYLTRDPSVKRATVEGHADERGDHSYNNNLSEQRAIAVRDYLLKNKVQQDKLSVRYFGKRKPHSSNKSSQGRAMNRRVNIILYRE